MTNEPHPGGIRTFLVVWITQSISVLGSSLTFFTVILWLTKTQYPAPAQKQELAFALSAIGLARAVPTLITAPIAGAWADRWDRKTIMVIANLVSGGFAAILMGLMLSNTLHLWPLIGVQIGLSIAGTFHSASFDTCYATLVPSRFLPRANGLMQTMWSLSTIFAPTVATFIIALPDLARRDLLPGPVAGALAGFNDGAVLAIGADMVSFWIVAMILVVLTIPSPKRPEKATRDKHKLSDEIKEGVRYILQRPAFLWLLVAFTVANFVVSTRGVFQPLILKFNLADDWAARSFTYDTALALLNTMASVGGLIGGILISSWGGLKSRRIYGVLWPMVIFSVGQIIFGLSTQIYITVAAAIISSAAIPILNAHSQTIWQSHTPRELQGRVFSVRRLIAQCTLPLGTTLAGMLGGLFNPGLVMAMLGVVMGGYCISQFFNRRLLQIENEVQPTMDVLPQATNQ